jgi:hypothetical protein
LVAFGAPFFDSGLGAPGPFGKQIQGDGLEQRFKKLRLLAGLSCGGVNGGGKMMQAIEGAFEGKPLEGDMIS